MRAMGIDYGAVRIGVAVSDGIGLMAHPLETIDCGGGRNSFERLGQLARERRIEVIVVGMPYRADGSEGPAARKVRGFIRGLAKVLPPGVAVETIDEGFSTVEAQRQLHGVGKRVRKSRKVIDQAAAAVILQEWMDMRQGEILPGPEEDLPGW